MPAWQGVQTATGDDGAYLQNVNFWYTNVCQHGWHSGPGAPDYQDWHAWLRVPSVAYAGGLAWAGVGYRLNVVPATVPLTTRVHTIREDNHAAPTDYPTVVADAALRSVAYAEFVHAVDGRWQTYSDRMIDVTAAVREILSRPGWGSGNALGFQFVNQGNPGASDLCDMGEVGHDGTAWAKWLTIVSAGYPYRVGGLRGANTGGLTGSTSHNIYYPPDGPPAGALLVAWWGHDGTCTVTWPAGWTEIADYNDGAGLGLAVAWKRATGLEGPGAYITVTSSATEMGSGAIAAFAAADDPPIISPEAHGTGTNPDPPAVTGPKVAKYLAMPIAVMDYYNRYATGFPAGYDHFWHRPPAGAYTGSSTHAAAAFIGDGQTFDPGTFTFSASDEWIAATVLIPGLPAAEAWHPLIP